MKVYTLLRFDPMGLPMLELLGGYRHGHGLLVGHGLLGEYGHLESILMASIRIELLGGHRHEHGLMGGYGHLDGIFNSFNQEWDVGWA